MLCHAHSKNCISVTKSIYSTQFVSFCSYSLATSFLQVSFFFLSFSFIYLLFSFFFCVHWESLTIDGLCVFFFRAISVIRFQRNRWFVCADDESNIWMLHTHLLPFHIWTWKVVRVAKMHTCKTTIFTHTKSNPEQKMFKRKKEKQKRTACMQAHPVLLSFLFPSIFLFAFFLLIQKPMLVG